jgi:hypothetical protein
MKSSPTRRGPSRLGSRRRSTERMRAVSSGIWKGFTNASLFGRLFPAFYAPAVPPSKYRPKTERKEWRRRLAMRPRSSAMTCLRHDEAP